MHLPYPGLRSFRSDEWPIFFGRENCIDDMIERLAKTKFLAVLGASGSGKSSLVFTGLLRSLELGFFGTAGSRWRFLCTRPGGGPLRNLAKAMAHHEEGSSDHQSVDILRSFLARGPRSLIEWYRSNCLQANENLLLVIDQFEELFRYADYGTREEAEAFMSLLIESVNGSNLPIYVVITMRSEFLGACSLIPGLAKQINKSFYLAPRMTREECEEAIVGPAEYFGFAVEPELVNHLLNDMASFAPWEEGQAADQTEVLSRRADQLPLMQHILNRIWLVATAESEGRSVLLTREQYEKIGGFAGALDKHGEEIIAQLSPQARQDLERVFRALMAGSSAVTAVRRPCTFSDLTALATYGQSAVAEIVDAFRWQDSNFLQPPMPQKLDETTVIDITHESLIRQWKALGQWLRNELQSAENWYELVRRTCRHSTSPGVYLSGLDLSYMVQWWERESPSPAWGKRYGGSFSEVSTFLAESKNHAAELERQQKDKAELHRIELARIEQRARRWILGISIIVALTLGIAAQPVWSLLRRAKQSDAQRASLEKKLVDKTQDLARVTNDVDDAKSKISITQGEATIQTEKARSLQDELRRAQLALIEERYKKENLTTDLEKARLDLSSSIDSISRLQKQLGNAEAAKIAAVAAQKARDEIAQAKVNVDDSPQFLKASDTRTIIYISKETLSGNTIYHSRLPAVYIDGLPYAYTQPDAYFSTRLSQGGHQICVSDSSPLTPCESKDFKVTDTEVYLRLQFQSGTRTSPGKYTVTVTQRADKPIQRVAQGNVLNLLRVEN